MAPASKLPAGSNSPRSRAHAAFENSSAAAAIMAQGKLSSEAGMAAASQAAVQARLKAQAKHQEELRAAVLTPPAHRTPAQVAMLCEYLSSAHLLRHLQPTNIKDLAQTMTGRACADGDVIYRQGDPANHFYIVVLGEVVMYEAEAAASSSTQWQHDHLAVGALQDPAAAAHAAHAGGRLPDSPGRHSKSEGPTAAPTDANGSANSPRSPALGQGINSTPSLATTGANSSSSTSSDALEVRRVGPREAFGEDDITAGSVRQETAVAGGATSSTFATGHAGTGVSSNSAANLSTANDRQAGAQLLTGVSVRRRTRGENVSLPGGNMAAASSTVLLQLSAADYGAVLEGRLSAMLEEKVNFLAELPALKGLSPAYLHSLSHCCHQVEFEPQEVLVRQGGISDCIYVLKSGQVCVLIDPNMTLSGDTISSPAGQVSTALPAGADAGDVNTSKLVQVCLLGAGSIIGDMSVREGAGMSAPRRSATVVALTELITYKVPLGEFKRRMPTEVLEGMRKVASQKLVMNERQATSRAGAGGKDGHVLLGGAAVPEEVLRGKGLRALMEAQQGEGQTGGLLEALEMYLGGGGKLYSSSRLKYGGKVAEVEDYVNSLVRNGFVTAPPQEFLALMTDWSSARHATSVTPADRKVPATHEFSLPVHQQHCSNPPALLITMSAAAPAAKSAILSHVGRTSPRCQLDSPTARSAAMRHSPHHAVDAQLQNHTADRVAAAAATSAAMPVSSLTRTPRGHPIIVVGDRGIAATGAAANSYSPLSDSSSSNPASPGRLCLSGAQPAQMQSPTMAGSGGVSSPRSFRETLDQLANSKQQQQRHHHQLQPPQPPCGQDSAGSSKTPVLGLHAAAGSNNLLARDGASYQAAVVASKAATQRLFALTSGSTAVYGPAPTNQAPCLGPACGGGFKGNLHKTSRSPSANQKASSPAAEAPAAAALRVGDKPQQAGSSPAASGIAAHKPQVPNLRDLGMSISKQQHNAVAASNQHDSLAIDSNEGSAGPRTPRSVAIMGPVNEQ